MKASTKEDDSALATARVQWQFGLWDALATTEPNTRGSRKRTRKRIELLHYLVQGALQTGQFEAAQKALDALREAGVEQDVLLHNLVSSAYNSLGRAWLAIGEADRAERCIRHSVRLYPELGEESLVAGMRLSQQAYDLRMAGARTRYRSLDRKDRRLFIDCGGYDGCSVLMFLITHPHFDCVSFEPNPELWEYYDDLPTQLIRKAAYTYDGEIDFIVDPVDADGSSICPSKLIDFHQEIENKDCPVISVPCVDLSAFIQTAAETYGTIFLKIDVEGAEYDILEKMLQDETIAHLKGLSCEFHGDKMGLNPARHERVVEQIEKYLPIGAWNALPFSIHGNNSTRTRKLRRELIQAIHRNRETFQLVGDSLVV